MISKKIEAFLKNHRIEPESQTARSYIFDCPACNGKKKLYIDKKSGGSICFKKDTEGCPSSGGPVIYPLSLLSQIPYKEVKEELFPSEIILSEGVEINIEWDIEKTLPVEDQLLEPCGLPLDAVFITSPNAAPGVAYLASRGITLDLAIKHGVMYSSKGRRVVFTVVMNGKLYGWQGRAIDPVKKEHRMYNMPGRWKAQTLMFYENLKGKDYAILAEGPISALKFSEVGGFVASMGKLITHAQLDLIKKAGIKKLYLSLDRDAADKMVDIEKYMNKDGDSVQCYIIEVPSHRDDFGDCTPQECLEAFLKAQSFDRDGIYVSIDASPKSVKKYMENR